MREVDIRDGRGEAFDLDSAGFMLMDHASSVTDWHDDAMLSQTYEAEAKALVRRITGAGRIEVFDHTRRAASDSLRRNQVMREPSSVIHNDYTPWSAERRLRDILPDEADAAVAAVRHRQYLALDRRHGRDQPACLLRQPHAGRRRSGRGHAAGE